MAFTVAAFRRAEWPAARVWCRLDRRWHTPGKSWPGSGDHTRQDQVFPDLGSHGNPIFHPGFDPIRRAGGDGFALVAALQRADLLAVDGLRPLPHVGRGLVAASREVGRQAQQITLQPAACTSANLTPASITATSSAARCGVPSATSPATTGSRWGLWDAPAQMPAGRPGVDHRCDPLPRSRRKSPPEAPGWPPDGSVCSGSFASRSPESGHIHGDGSIAFVTMHLPAGQPFDLLLPQPQEHAVCQTPRRKAAQAPGSLPDRPVACSAGKSAPRWGSRAPLTSIHRNVKVPDWSRPGDLGSGDQDIHGMIDGGNGLTSWFLFLAKQAYHVWGPLPLNPLVS
jgi:hypothetical protein